MLFYQFVTSIVIITVNFKRQIHWISNSNLSCKFGGEMFL